MRRALASSGQRWVRACSSRVDLSAVTALAVDPALDPLKIRSFCIIAHVDHGKSTLADRLLEATGNIGKIADGKEVHCQVLDTLQVEKERGITVRSQNASMAFRGHLLQLIDTPGHIDFSNEVLRSISSCEGAILLADSSQGLEAQTLAVYALARTAGLDIIPVLTKCDLPASQPQRVLEQMFNAFDIDPDTVLLTSAKTGAGITSVLTAIIDNVRPPVPHFPDTTPTRALIISTWFDPYKGAICLVKIDQGCIEKGQMLCVFHSKSTYIVQDIGIVCPNAVSTGSLRRGQVGYIVMGVKSLQQLRLGDTLFSLPPTNRPSAAAPVIPVIEPLPGFDPPKPMVWASIFPLDSEQLEELQSAFDKLTMNDLSLQVAKDKSAALGSGFRCGLLGVLHLEVLKDRLIHEFGLETIVTAPIVPFKAVMKNGETILITSPTTYPPNPALVDHFMEPFILATIVVSQKHLGRIQELCKSRRGAHQSITFLSDESIVLKYRLPTSELIDDFHGHIKSLSSGYASFDYDDAGTDRADLVLLDILLNGKPIDALSIVCVRENSYSVGKGIASRLKANLTRQSFEVIIQAAIGGKIVARERLPPFRKDVLTKGGKTVGGGDRSRKMKLLEKQNKGKKRMKSIGNIEVSQAAFLSVLSKANTPNDP